MKKLIFLFFLFPLFAFAQEGGEAETGKPEWLLDLEAERAMNPTTVIERTIGSKPENSLAGYWKMVQEKIAVDGEWRPMVTASGRGVDVYRPPHYKIIRTFTWIEIGASFKGNPNSKIFHKEGCRYWDSAGSTAEFVAHEEALEQGYRACGVCNPMEGIDIDAEIRTIRPTQE